MIFLPQVNSTNIYATQRINDGLSVHGEVIWTHHQTAGKGQRGKTWEDEAAQSVLMSIVLLENLDQMGLFQLNAIVALAVRELIAAHVPGKKVSIKWPNDIFINDKKTCGILIENSFRGSLWHASVAGIGINVLQERFGSELMHATSLLMESGRRFEPEQLIASIRENILSMIRHYVSDPISLLEEYNRYLYKLGLETAFTRLENGALIKAKVLGVHTDGRLMLRIGEQVEAFRFGTIQWLPGSGEA